MQGDAVGGTVGSVTTKTPATASTVPGVGRLVGVDVEELTDTQAPGTESVPAGRCDYHKGPSETAVLVDAIEKNSAPPVPLYACAPCREQRGLIPLADRP